MWKLVWEQRGRQRIERYYYVLILVCVEVSVGDRENRQNTLKARAVLILVCVEVSVGVKGWEIKAKFGGVLILVCVEVSVGEMMVALIFPIY